MSNLEAEIESLISWELLCLRLDSNQHARRALPPQGSVYTNFTT